MDAVIGVVNDLIKDNAVIGQVDDLIKDNDGVILYVIFALQCCMICLGFPLMFCQCSSPEKRAVVSHMGWMAKWSLLVYIGKWTLDTYDMVEV